MNTESLLPKFDRIARRLFPHATLEEREDLVGAAVLRAVEIEAKQGEVSEGLLITSGRRAMIDVIKHRNVEARRLGIKVGGGWVARDWIMMDWIIGGPPYREAYQWSELATDRTLAALSDMMLREALTRVEAQLNERDATLLREVLSPSPEFSAAMVESVGNHPNRRIRGIIVDAAARVFGLSVRSVRYSLSRIREAFEAEGIFENGGALAC